MGPMTSDNDPLTERVIGLAIEVHRQLGPGLLESAYEGCLCYELVNAKFIVQRQVALPVVYKSVRLDCEYRLDVVVENRLILELKTVERLMPIHEAQVITYLRLSGIPTGLLLNFNSVALKHGIRRLMLSGRTEPPDLIVSPSHCD
jgi:GxxExxY protein